MHIVADVNVAIRKIALLLKPDKDIVQNGDHLMIKTLSTFKNYNMDFYVGKEFEEDLSGVDDRKCMVRGFVWSTTSGASQSAGGCITKKNNFFLKVWMPVAGIDSGAAICDLWDDLAGAHPTTPLQTAV